MVYKQYLYKAMYIQGHIEDMAKAGYIKKDLVLIDADDDENLLITITSDNNGGKFSILISRAENKESLLGYQDCGETMRYMKLLGKLNTAAYIASCIHYGSSFYIMDKSKVKYGIMRARVMENDYIILGGYDNPTEFYNINGVIPRNVTALVLRKLIEASREFCIFHARSLVIHMGDDTATSLDSSIFAKPYVVYEPENGWADTEENTEGSGLVEEDADESGYIIQE